MLQRSGSGGGGAGSGKSSLSRAGSGDRTHKPSAALGKPLGLYKQESMTKHSVGRGSEYEFDEDAQEEENEEDDDDDDCDRETIPGKRSNVCNVHFIHRSAISIYKHMQRVDF